MYTLTGKPNSYHDSADGEEDGKFLGFDKKKVTADAVGLVG